MVRIVHEKYLNQAKTGDKAQLQNFLSELYIYVFLCDQMHTGLNKVYLCKQSCIVHVVHVHVRYIHESTYMLVISWLNFLFSQGVVAGGCHAPSSFCSRHWPLKALHLWSWGEWRLRASWLLATTRRELVGRTTSQSCGTTMPTDFKRGQEWAVL